MWSLVEDYEISKKIIDDLFDGVESDIKHKLEKLLLYAYINKVVLALFDI